MAKRRIIVVYVEDNAVDRQSYGQHLQACKGTKVIVVHPPETPDARVIAQHKPDIVLLDYLLSERTPGQPSVSYRGGTLAAALRERLPSTPVVLITRGSLQKHLGEPVRDISGAFDELVYKGDVSRNPEAFCEDVRVLVEGFHELRDLDSKSLSSLWRALGAVSEERDLLLQAGPPEVLFADKSWRVPEVSRWIRNVLLEYPGILYDSLHASVLLGITEGSFLQPESRVWFSEAMYTGPFVPPEGRWWRDRLIIGALSLWDRAGLGEASLAHFREKWNSIKKSRLRAAKCVQSGEEPADCVCFVLRQPVMRKYSLPYHPDNRPAVMDEARVSFKAIQETNDYDERLFTRDARPLAREIQRGAGRE